MLDHASICDLTIPQGVIRASKEMPVVQARRPNVNQSSLLVRRVGAIREPTGKVSVGNVKS
jgi:hypothetical protein